MLTTSMAGFFIFLSLFAIGAIGSLLLGKNDGRSNKWGGFFAIAGSIGGLIFSISTIITGQSIFFSFNSPSLPLFALSFHVDMLSAFFIFVISLVALFCSVYGVGYAKHFYKKYSIGTLGFFYNLLVASLILVVTASNALFFLVAWELMSISSYFLVVYDRKDEKNIKAGSLYLIMTYIGTAFIILAFLFLYKYTGSFDFSAIKAGMALVPPQIKDLIFIFALIGFGAKAGIIPLHIWLPAAHPAAPSHVSALMSGVMIKTGIYMMVRVFMDILGPSPIWWGLVVLLVGAISSLLGVLYALSEHDLKRLLAYHSIENIGIILLGLGGAMTFSSLGMSSFALLSLMAALFHTLNHAIFKSLLFLSAGSVINETHTRNMEEYGGLIKFMPQTAMFFLIGSMAISALPPFNGFFSEWLTFQALFAGITQSPSYSQWIFMIAAGSLAFTGGLALACFVKAFGSTFLARPRSPEVAHAKESAFSMRAAMGALAVLSLLFGLFSGYVIIFLEKIGKGLSVFQNTVSSISVSSGQSLNFGKGFASVSAPAIFVFLLGTILIVAIIARYAINKNQKIRIGTTWDCGTDLTSRMEITSTGFARSILIIFRGILKPSIQHTAEYNDAESRYLPSYRAVTLGIGDVYNSYLYQPIHKMVSWLSSRAKIIQTGNVNTYISYIFIALIITLLAIL